MSFTLTQVYSEALVKWCTVVIDSFNLQVLLDTIFIHFEQIQFYSQFWQQSMVAFSWRFYVSGTGTQTLAQNSL